MLKFVIMVWVNLLFKVRAWDAMESVGLLKMLLRSEFVWKVRALKKMPRWKVILLSLWKVRVSRRFHNKMQQVSVESWVIAFCSISVKSAGFQKLP